MSSRERFDRRARIVLQRGLQHEVFRRIADDEEFGEKDDVGVFGFARALPRQAQIAGDVAHDGIELGQRDFKPIGHGRV